MPDENDPTMPPELTLLEKEIAARRYIEQRHTSFTLAPSTKKAEQLIAAIEQWRVTVHPDGETGGDRG